MLTSTCSYMHRLLITARRQALTSSTNNLLPACERFWNRTRHSCLIGPRLWSPQTFCSTTAAAERTPTSNTQTAAIQALTPIKTAIQCCCVTLGRPFGPAEASLAERLEDNWYSSAGEAAGLTEAEAAALKVPLRFLHQLRKLISQTDTQPESPAALTALKAEALVHDAQSVGQEESYPVTKPDFSDESTLQAAISQAPQLIAAVADLPNDIMQRRCPKMQRFSHGSAHNVRVSKRKRLQPYALKKDELQGKLQQQFLDFHKFCTTRFFGQQADPIAACTAVKYADHVRGILGWLHTVKGIPMKKLSFQTALPSQKRQGVAVAFEYIQWLVQDRDISATTEGLVIRSLMQGNDAYDKLLASASLLPCPWKLVTLLMAHLNGQAPVLVFQDLMMAKFLFHDKSVSQPLEGEKAYGDLLVVKELRKLQSSNRKTVKVAVRVSDESMKWLEWPEYLRTVQELRRECAGRNHIGAIRARTAVAWSLQRYLIFAILSSIPDRQRTLRELQLGQTLFKDEQGRWIIRHGPAHYKTGKTYGERPPMVLAPHIYPELEAFLDEWRAELGPTHDFVFTKADGMPLTEGTVYKIFYTSSYRITGKKTNPHLVRDSIVTYLRSSGVSERELEALAIYMGHSLDMQRGTYDRRTKAAKVEPAIELLSRISQGAQTN